MSICLATGWASEEDYITPFKFAVSTSAYPFCVDFLALILLCIMSAFCNSCLTKSVEILSAVLENNP